MNYSPFSHEQPLKGFKKQWIISSNCAQFCLFVMKIAAHILLDTLTSKSIDRKNCYLLLAKCIVKSKYVSQSMVLITLSCHDKK